MKKATGIILGVLAVAAMVLLLAGNKKKSTQQAEAVSRAEGTEVVTTCIVTRENAVRSFTSNATVQAGSELNFVSEVTGRVVEVYVDKGSRVAKGTPVLKIDSDLIEADYKAALASYEALKKDEQRFSRSFEAGGISNQQLDNVRTQLIAAESRLALSKWKLDNAVVKSPVCGTVNARFVETGALIAPNVPLFEIVDDRTLKMTCNIPESRISRVHKGQRVNVTDARGLSCTGVVKNIGVKTDRGLNYPVEVVLNKVEGLHPGMYVKAEFSSDEPSEALFIPRKAVVGSTLSADVYVVRDGRAERREVKLGDMLGERIEILEGLGDGEEIVISGLMNVADGCSVNVVNK